MNKRDKQARAILKEIQQVLLHEWDPIGIKDEPLCFDEYDGYAGGVYRMLERSASVEEIAEHLARIERERMGFRKAKADFNLPVAKKLKKLDVWLDMD